MLKSFTAGAPIESGKSQKEKDKLKKKLAKFKNNVLQNIDEIIDDIENVYDEITDQAGDHFNPKDIILTYGKSDLLNSFLIYAYYGGEQGERKPGAKDFEVLVCETAPLFTGHKTAKKLKDAGLSVNLITDSSVFALMSRIDKVMISAQAILANGGLIASAGAYNICLAAKVSISYLSYLFFPIGAFNSSYCCVSYVQVDSNLPI